LSKDGRRKRMISKTISIQLGASKDEVFSFLSKPDNLPKWATEFCHEMKISNGKYKVVTCDPESAELFFKIEADPKTGVIDMFAGPREDRMAIFPSRVINIADGLSLYVFTMFQAPGMSKDKFQTQYESLKREMENIRKKFP
jgi:hypothetical protein